MKSTKDKKNQMIPTKMANPPVVDEFVFLYALTRMMVIIKSATLIQAKQ